MREVDAQSLIIKLVNARGGYAHKRTNRFMSGISDLLVKLPDHPAFFAEVKMRVLRGDVIRQFTLNGVTELQRHDLRKAQTAGMNGAVISFLQMKDGLRSMHMGAFMIDELDAREYRVSTEQHESIGNGSEREAVMWRQLTRIAEWKS